MTKIFISYSRVDFDSFARPLIEILQKRYGFDNVLYDQNFMHTGQRWWQAILDKIHDADVFLYILTNDSVDSLYCQAEHEEARRLGLPIVYVQARGRTRIPDEILDYQYLDMVNLVDDAFTITQLFNDIDFQANKDRARRPYWQPATPQPRNVPTPEQEQLAANDRDQSEISTIPILTLNPSRQNSRDGLSTISIIGGAIGVIAIIGIILFIVLSGGSDDESNNDSVTDNSPEATTVVAQNPTVIDTTVPSPTPISPTAIVLTATNPLTFTPSPDLDATALAQANQAQTQTVLDTTSTAESWTDTSVPSNTPTATSTFTDTPTPSFTPTFTSTPTPNPFMQAEDGILSNSRWTSIEVAFEAGVPMVLVPRGSFVMGSDEDAQQYTFELCQEASIGIISCNIEWDEDERPISSQQFDQAFWIDKTEVTVAMYQACADDGRCDDIPSLEVGIGNQPITQINWFRAQEYCEWRGARLPTEREWEYAARGPNSLRYPWGNEMNGNLANHCDVNCAQANFSNNYDFLNINHDDGVAELAEVGLYPAGASWVGALDMSGNVWEWTQSLYYPYPYEENDNRNSEDQISVPRVMKGGSYVDMAAHIHAADRLQNDPQRGYPYAGFRCARDYISIENTQDFNVDGFEAAFMSAILDGDVSELNTFFCEEDQIPEEDSEPPDMDNVEFTNFDCILAGGEIVCEFTAIVEGERISDVLTAPIIDGKFCSN